MRPLGRRRKLNGTTAELGFCLLFRRVDIGRNFFSVLFIVVRQNIAIGHAQNLQAVDPRHLLFVNEIGIAESLEPVEIVENGVIDAVCAGGADVSGRYAQVLQEHGVV